MTKKKKTVTKKKAATKKRALDCPNCPWAMRLQKLEGVVHGKQTEKAAKKLLDDHAATITARLMIESMDLRKVINTSIQSMSEVINEQAQTIKLHKGVLFNVRERVEALEAQASPADLRGTLATMRSQLDLAVAALGGPQ